jgi:hypothetical protein
LSGRTASFAARSSGKLPAAAIAKLTEWVQLGAPDPRDAAPAIVVAAMSWKEILAERRDWWSLKPIVKPAVPTPQNAAWSIDPVDRFVVAALEAKGLAPAPPADSQTLLRRLSLVLTGLPPSLLPSVSPSGEEGETERRRD